LLEFAFIFSLESRDWDAIFAQHPIYDVLDIYRPFCPCGDDWFGCRI
jgi:hypothetical protein